MDDFLVGSEESDVTLPDSDSGDESELEYDDDDGDDDDDDDLWDLLMVFHGFHRLYWFFMGLWFYRFLN